MSVLSAARRAARDAASTTRLLWSERLKLGLAEMTARTTRAESMRDGCGFASFQIGAPKRSPDLSKRTLSTVLSCAPMDGPVTRSFLRQDTVMTCCRLVVI